MPSIVTAVCRSSDHSFSKPDVLTIRLVAHLGVEADAHLGEKVMHVDKDAWVPEFEGALRERDLAIFTADHGCDPCIPGTDHSREYVPLLALGRKVKRGVDLGLRQSLSDIGQTVAANFGAELVHGTSFLAQIV